MNEETPIDRGIRIARGLELNDVAVWLEKWACEGPPGWQNAARCFAAHVRKGWHRTDEIETKPSEEKTP